MKYALIGCGRISTNHIRAAKLNDLEISAVCDIIPERMEYLLKKHGLENENIARYTDYKKMMAEISPELVAVVTESGNHASIALDCLDFNANLIIEKPIALSLEDADSIIEKVSKKGVKACACHQNRFNSSVSYMREALEKGRFGRISHGSVNIRWNRNKDYYKQAPWRGTWAQDGGALMNQSIHGIDLFRWMLGGKIEEVFSYTARQFHDYIECEDVGVAVVKFKNGALGTIEGTTNVYPKNLEETLYVFGENGTVKLGGKSANSIEVWNFRAADPVDTKLRDGFTELTDNVYGNGHTPLYSDMIAAIKNNLCPYIGLDAGRDALELVLAIYKSSKEGIAVKFPYSNNI